MSKQPQGLRDYQAGQRAARERISAQGLERTQADYNSGAAGNGTRAYSSGYRDAIASAAAKATEARRKARTPRVWRVYPTEITMGDNIAFYDPAQLEQWAKAQGHELEPLGIRAEFINQAEPTDPPHMCAYLYTLKR